MPRNSTCGGSAAVAVAEGRTLQAYVNRSRLTPRSSRHIQLPVRAVTPADLHHSHVHDFDCAYSTPLQWGKNISH